MSCSNTGAASFVSNITGGVNQQYEQAQSNHGALAATVGGRDPAPFQSAFGSMSGGKRRRRSMRIKRHLSRRKPKKQSRRKHTHRTRKMRR